MKDETKLTHEGEEEMLLLAERMQNRFPDVFDDVYSNTTYKVGIIFFHWPKINISLNFSLSIHILKEQKKVPFILLLVYLENAQLKMFHFLNP